MDVEKLIDHLKECGTYGFKQEKCREAAEALTTLQIELKAMRSAANSYKAENARLESELEKAKMARPIELTGEGAEAFALAAELSETKQELEKVKAERDAAVEYLRGQCRYCKRDLVCTGRKGPHSNCWEWRGPQKEE